MHQLVAFTCSQGGVQVAQAGGRVYRHHVAIGVFDSIYCSVALCLGYDWAKIINQTQGAVGYTALVCSPQPAQTTSGRMDLHTHVCAQHQQVYKARFALHQQAVHIARHDCMMWDRGRMGGRGHDAVGEG